MIALQEEKKKVQFRTLEMCLRKKKNALNADLFMHQR